MKAKEYYENLENKKGFTKLTSTGISSDYENVFEFAEAYHKQASQSLDTIPTERTDEEKEDKLKQIWNIRNPVHDLNADTEKDMFWGTVIAIFKDYDEWLTKGLPPIEGESHA